MKVLGVSGSPIHNSNTDRALKIVLEATDAKKIEFIKLSDYNVAPCNACLGCIDSNRCVLEDDGIALAEKAYKADALIIAGYTPYSSLDSRSKTFIERLYPLRHRHGLMAGKPGAAVVTCAIPPNRPELPAACDNGIRAIQDFMTEEGMIFAGGVSVPGNVPCVKCGDSGQCQQSGLKMIHGPDATMESIGINSVEDNLELVASLQQLGKDVRAKFYGA
ncbi:MAG: flavodoxin family protein [Desulfobulbaceae bacterium]|nr:flavodoxin family protein [Desulfobulbaceae bacterium]